MDQETHEAPIPGVFRSRYHHLSPTASYAPSSTYKDYHWIPLYWAEWRLALAAEKWLHKRDAAPAVVFSEWTLWTLQFRKARHELSWAERWAPSRWSRMHQSASSRLLEWRAMKSSQISISSWGAAESISRHIYIFIPLHPPLSTYLWSILLGTTQHKTNSFD